VVDYKDFQEKIRKAKEEWLQRDLVVDTRETWAQFLKRNMNFEDAKMVPREELPEQF